MASRLIVVTGAGASFDCAGPDVARDAELRPPLVADLFDRKFADILNEYPLAEQVAPNIRASVGTGAIALERYLREELLGSSFPHLRRRYQAIPLYLQHLFWKISEGYTQHPDNYDRLITEALRLDRVTFVTLNYDTILDQRLAIDSSLDDIADYVSSTRTWSLVKLHGSVNWGRRLVDGPDVRRKMITPGLMVKTYAADFATIGEDPTVADEIELRTGSLEDFRTDASAIHRGSLFYPVVAVPLGSQDEIVCPASHVEHLREHIRDSAEGLNLLVIGYSGLDQEVLGLLGWSERPVRALRVINGSYERSMETVQTLAQRLRFPPTEEMAFAGGFSDFINTDLERFIRSLG